MWAIFIAALSYAPAALLGAGNGMNREVPRLIGAGRNTEAVASEEAVSSLGLIVVGVVGLGGLGLGLLLPPALAIGFTTAAAGVILYQFQQFALRSNLRFNRASMQQLTFGIILLVLAGILLAAGELGLEPATLGYGSALALAVVTGAFLHPLRFRASALRLIPRLIGIGLPIMFAGVVFAILVTADRWIAVGLLDPEDAGAYGFASLVASAMLIVPSVISQQIYPRMALAHGQDRPIGHLWQMAGRQALASAAMTAPIALAIAVGIATLVPEFVPEYGAAILPTATLCVGYVVLVLGNGYGNFLNVVGAQRQYLGAQLVSTGLAFSLMAAGALIGGLTGIAIMSVVSFATYAAIVRLTAGHVFRNFNRGSA